jgi:hypothetical protein
LTYNARGVTLFIVGETAFPHCRQEIEMFYERPGTVKVIYTVDVTGMEPVTGACKSRAIIPAVGQVTFWAGKDSIDWDMKIQGGVAKKDGTAGEAIQEHEFSTFWSRSGTPAPDGVMAIVERFQPRAAAAIHAGMEG